MFEVLLLWKCYRRWDVAAVEVLPAMGCLVEALWLSVASGKR